MYRRILCLGLLVSVAQLGYAAECDVGVVLQGGSVEFDPFNPGATQLSLIVMANKAYTNVSVKFAGSLRSVYSDATSDTPIGTTVYSTLEGYPDYVIGDSTLTSTYFNSDNQAGSYPEVVTGVSWANGSTNTYPILVKPNDQQGTETALSPLSQDTVTLPVIIEGEEGGADCAGTHTVTMTVDIPTKTTVSFSDANFSNVGGSLDAETVGRDASVTKSSFLYVWSNTKYKIKAESANGGVMVRNQGNGAPVNSSAINQLPYKLSFGTTSSFFLGRDDITSTTGAPVGSGESSDEGATLVNGGRVDINFTTQDTGKRAGSYTDIVTISIVPQL